MEFELENKISYQGLIGELAIPHVTTRCQKVLAAMLGNQDIWVELGANCLKLPLKPKVLSLCRGSWVDKPGEDLIREV